MMVSQVYALLNDVADKDDEQTFFTSANGQTPSFDVVVVLGDSNATTGDDDTSMNVGL